MSLPRATSLEAKLPVQVQDGDVPIPYEIRGVFGDGQPATIPDGTVIQVSMFPTLPGFFQGPTVVTAVGNSAPATVGFVVKPAVALRLGYEPGTPVGLSLHFVAPALGIAGNSTTVLVSGWESGMPKLGHRVVVLIDPKPYEVPAAPAFDGRLAPDATHDVLLLDGPAPLFEVILSGSVPQ